MEYGIKHHVLMIAKKHRDISPAHDVFQNRDAVRAAVYDIPQDVQMIRIAEFNLAKHTFVFGYIRSNSNHIFLPIPLL